MITENVVTEETVEVPEANTAEYVGIAQELYSLGKELEEAAKDAQVLQSGEIVGKANFRAGCVQLRKDIRPIVDKTMQVWRDTFKFEEAHLGSIPSARKQKTKAEIMQEIEKLQKRAASM